MRIGILYGGESSEREVSLKSGNCIAEAVESLGHEAIKIDPRHIDITLQGFFNLDKVFIALHGGMGESGHLQALLDLLKIPYTGSGLLASSISLNKLKTKEIWRSNGLQTADWIKVNKHTPTDSIKTTLANLTYPVVVKPLKPRLQHWCIKSLLAGRALYNALVDAFEYDDDILVEQFITGREYTCAILDGKQIKSRPFFDWCQIRRSDGHIPLIRLLCHAEAALTA